MLRIFERRKLFSGLWIIRMTNEIINNLKPIYIFSIWFLVQKWWAIIFLNKEKKYIKSTKISGVMGRARARLWAKINVFLSVFCKHCLYSHFNLQWLIGNFDGDFQFTRDVSVFPSSVTSYTRLICVTEIGLPTREYRMTLKFNLKGLFLTVWMDQYENT